MDLSVLAQRSPEECREEMAQLAQPLFSANKLHKEGWAQIIFLRLNSFLSLS
jgi:hypothetical protein